MNGIRISKGDIFCTSDTGSVLASAINKIQKFWDVDDQSVYSHAGILTDPRGGTLEALWRIERKNLWDKYGCIRSCHILIGRHKLMNAERAMTGFEAVKEYEGRFYPIHRLPLHIIPPLAKFVSSGRFLVCSELTGKFLVGAGLLGYYKGLTPNYLADMITRWDDWEIVYEKQVC